MCLDAMILIAIDALANLVLDIVQYLNTNDMQFEDQMSSD